MPLRYHLDNLNYASVANVCITILFFLFNIQTNIPQNVKKYNMKG